MLMSRIIAALAIASVMTSVPARADGPVYFEVQGSTPRDTFVIALTDEAKIAHARRIVSGEEKDSVHVHGTIDPTAMRYNAPWSFHLAPDSIGFFAFAMEVCDAATSYVEEHLSEIGGAFLPGNHWCPWASRVIAEIEMNNGSGN